MLAAIKATTSGFGACATPLFEEEGDPGCLTSVSQITEPLSTARSMTPARFASRDQPVNLGEVEPVEWPEQGLGADASWGQRLRAALPFRPGS